MATLADELALSVIQIEAAIHHGHNFRELLDDTTDQLHDELAIVASENGSTREYDYCPEEHYEATIRRAHDKTNQKYQF